jgi:hypothetical protein
MTDDTADILRRVWARRRDDVQRAQAEQLREILEGEPQT